MILDPTDESKTGTKAGRGRGHGHVWYARIARGLVRCNRLHI